jgi:hypothetical protein
MNETDSSPRPDWAAMGWITDRLPTDEDADADGDVWIPRKITDSAENGPDRTYVSYLAVVAVGQPWWSLNAADRADEPATTEPAPITARQAVQIAFAAVDAETTCLIALCNDGSLWGLRACSTEWTELPAIPQS